MITSIVREVQSMLLENAAENSPTIEIIFPVAEEAIAETTSTDMPIVPGASSGEGCSIAGGCATCPFMKMNTLDALFDVVTLFDVKEKTLMTKYHPAVYPDLIGGETVSELGSVPIVHMKQFMTDGKFSDVLVKDIKSRTT